MDKQTEIHDIASRLGKLGGLKTAKTKGKKHFRQMALKSAEVRQAKAKLRKKAELSTDTSCNN